MLDPSLDAPGLSAVSLDLKALGDLCAELESRQGYAADLEAKLKTAKAQVRALEEGSIPEFLAAVGMTGVKLLSGASIDVKELLTASLSGAALPAAIAWLRETKNDGLIVTEVTTSFAKGKLSEAEELLADLQKREYNATLGENVNTGSFKSLVKELIEQGERVPLAQLGVFIVRKAVLTHPKKES